MTSALANLHLACTHLEREADLLPPFSHRRRELRRELSALRDLIRRLEQRAA